MSNVAKWRQLKPLFAECLLEGHDPHGRQDCYLWSRLRVHAGNTTLLNVLFWKLYLAGHPTREHWWIG